MACTLVMPLVTHGRWLAPDHISSVEHGSIATECDCERDAKSDPKVCGTAICALSLTPLHGCPHAVNQEGQAKISEKELAHGNQQTNCRADQMGQRDSNE